MADYLVNDDSPRQTEREEKHEKREEFVIKYQSMVIKISQVN